MKILLANPRGFCAGVIMAIDTVEEALKLVGTPIYVYHEIVHNRHVVADFVGKGVVFVDSIDDVPPRATVVFSAHGVSPEVRDAARERGCTLIDATCPLVTKVHMEAIRYARQGYKILLIGHAGHDEVVGTVGEAPDAITIVESPEDVEKLPFPGRGDRLHHADHAEHGRCQRHHRGDQARYPNVKEPPSEDICYATTNRQHAVRLLARDADLVLVVGSKNSSNSLRLTEIAEHSGTPAYLVDDVSEIDERWLDNVETLLITAGASAPEHLVAGIVEHLKQRYGAEVGEQQTTDENMEFELPRSLRVLREATAH
jgi:4-hydroxy-3-methylbut-2-enyl diphosphate reductase